LDSGQIQSWGIRNIEKIRGQQGVAGDAKPI
jgi:hypothetical protein